MELLVMGAAAHVLRLLEATGIPVVMTVERVVAAWYLVVFKMPFAVTILACRSLVHHSVVEAMMMVSVVVMHVMMHTMTLVLVQAVVMSMRSHKLLPIPSKGNRFLLVGTILVVLVPVSGLRVRG